MGTVSATEFRLINGTGIATEDVDAGEYGWFQSYDALDVRRAPDLYQENPTLEWMKRQKATEKQIAQRTALYGEGGANFPEHRFNLPGESISTGSPYG